MTTSRHPPKERGGPAWNGRRRTAWSAAQPPCRRACRGVTRRLVNSRQVKRNSHSHAAREKASRIGGCHPVSRRRRERSRRMAPCAYPRSEAFSYDVILEPGGLTSNFTRTHSRPPHGQP